LLIENFVDERSKKITEQSQAMLEKENENEDNN
jgi:hypothetical protein